MAKTEYSAGVVVHNEGGARSRLARWIEAWLPVVGEPSRLIVGLHSCTDDSARICEEHRVATVEIHVAGLHEALLWETVRLAPPDVWHWRTGGCDEYPSDGLADATRSVIAAHPGIRLYFVARRNIIEGVDVSDMMGPDWQCDLMLPHPVPIRFGGGVHTRPSVTLHGSAVGLLGPEVGHIRHERTWAEVHRCNMGRASYCAPFARDMQERFLRSLRERLRAAGVIVPSSEEGENGREP